jgi:hypothetical protein
MTDPRPLLLAASRSLVGLTEPDPALGALVDPGGDASHEAAVEHLSLCMLAYRGLVTRVFAIPAAVSHVDRPYVPGSIPALLWAILGALGHEGSAARVPTLEAPPSPGDGLWWGSAPGAAEHVDACVLEVAGEGTVLQLCAVAGGQRDAAGRETIAVVRRTIRWQGSRWVDTGDGRPLMAILGADEMATRWGLVT